MLRKKKKKAGDFSLTFSKGWPKTRRIADPENPGKKGFEIKATFINPGIVRYRRIILFFFLLILAFDLLDMNEWVEVKGVYPFLYAGLAGLGFISYWFFNWLMSRLLWIRYFEDRIEVAGWKEFEEYSTRVPHSFMFFRA